MSQANNSLATSNEFNDQFSNVPPLLRKALFPDEKVLAVVKPHGLAYVAPISLTIAVCTFGVCPTWLYSIYHAYLTRYKVLVLTDKRIIGCVKPKLLTKDTVDLFHGAVDNVQQDESILGNIFGWTKLRVETRL